MFQRARQSSRKSPSTVRLQLEVLEERAVPSRGALPEVVASSPPSTASAVVAHPDSTFTPLRASPSGASPNAGSGSVYYTPAQVRQAYGFNQTGATGAGQTIAIVDAYYDPNAYSDLTTFDQQTGLANPPSFKQVQMGGVTQVDSGWAAETSLDVQWAHAVAPAANILLVEAKSSSMADLQSAVSYAASQPGVAAVSMSWGAPEFSGENSFDSTYLTPKGHPGVTFIASSGDAGSAGAPEYPSVSPNVLAVGGTTLNLASANGYGSETAWSGSGGGLSRFEFEPAFQKMVQGTGVRTTPDVGYDANPSTGFLVYDSVPQNGQAGWWVVGGTSAGAPQWAGIIALTDQVRAANGKAPLANAASYLYTLPSSDFHDVTSGSNGGYSAGRGYDLVTGLGSPIVNLVVSDLAKK